MSQSQSHFVDAPLRHPVAHDYDGHDLEALVCLDRYYRWIRRAFGSHLSGRVLEVGAGTGNFSQYYVSDVVSATLVEPSHRLLPSLRARFQSRRNVDVFHGTVADLIDARPQDHRAYDCAIMVNVLEHIEHDVAHLRLLSRLLKVGARLLLFVPAIPALYGTLDECVNHCRRYSRSTLCSIVQASGFTILDVRYFDLAGILPWFVMGRVLKLRRFNPQAATLYDRLVVPLMAPLESRVSLPLGKNLLCVAAWRDERCLLRRSLNTSEA